MTEDRTAIPIDALETSRSRASALLKPEFAAYLDENYDVISRRGRWNIYVRKEPPGGVSKAPFSNPEL